MRFIRHLIIATLLTTLVLSHGACSFAFVDGPPSDHRYRSESFNCTTSAFFPIVDSTWAGLNAGGVVNALTAEEGEIENRDQVVAIGLLWVAVSGAAAIYGASKVKSCKKAKKLQNERLAARESLVGTPIAALDEPAESQKPAMVPFDQLKGHRVAGESEIPVPERVRETLRQRGERTVAATVKMCLDTTGNVTSLDIVESSNHRVYDGQILVSMRTWQFRGHPMPNGAKRICTHVPVSHDVQPNG